MSWISDLARDFRHASRVLAKNPKFTAVVVLTLALGVGATTAIFTVVDRVLLAPLAYRDAGRIVNVVTRWRDTGRTTPRLTGGDLVDIRQESGIFAALSTYVGGVRGRKGIGEVGEVEGRGHRR